MGRYHNPARYHGVPTTANCTILSEPVTPKLSPRAVARLEDGTVLVEGVDPEWRAEHRRYLEDARQGKFYYESEHHKPIL